MSHTEEECPFNTLPTEIVVWIMDFVPFPENKLMRFVCDRWRRILDSSFFKYNNVVINGNDSVKYLLKTNVMIQNVTFENITQADWPYPTRTRNHFPRIQGLALENGNAEDVLMEFLKRFGLGNLESLRLREYSFLNCGIRKMTSALRDSEWENLCELELKLNNLDWFADDDIRLRFQHMHPRSVRVLIRKYFVSIGRFLELVTAPKLRKFTFVFRDVYRQHAVGWSKELFKPLIPKIYQFISRHSKTLKVLDWTVWFYKPLRDALRGWKVTKDLQETISRNLKLETFSTRFMNWHSIGRLNFVFPCVWGATGLKTFSCDIWSNENWWLLANNQRNKKECFLNKMEETMEMNKHTLQDVSIRLISTISLKTLNNSHSLRKLTLNTNQASFNDLDTNMDLRLPTVTHLELALYSTPPSTFDEWVVSVFRDLEKIKLTLVPGWTISLPILKKFLLRFPRLRDLNEAHFIPLFAQTDWFDPNVKLFCERSVDPVLNYKITPITGRTCETTWADIKVTRK